MEVNRFRELGRHVASRQDEDLESALPDEELRQKLALRAGVSRSRASARSRWQLPALAAVVLVAGIVAILARRAPGEPLTFTVGDPARTGVLQEWVSAPAVGPLPVRFSDGTRVTLEPRGRGRVVGVGPEGAEFVVEAGRADVDVVPNPDGDWRIRTGPFVVHVHGTRFTVDWDPTKDVFTLALYEGKVTVSGCTFGEGRRVEAGEQVRASCGTPAVSVSPMGGAVTEDVRGAAPTETPPESAAVQERSVPPLPRQQAAHVAPGHGAPVPESWIDLARAGHYRRAYDLASAAGFENEVLTRGASELLLLGDAARLSGHPGEARQVYEGARRRFAGSPHAATAAFALGRLAFDVSGDHAAASKWFETYLEEQPGGSVAPAALGRLLEAQVKLGHGARARSIARLYLDRHPGGPHADEAQKILASHD